MKILVLGHMGMLGTDIVGKLCGSHEVIGKDIDDFDITDKEDCRRVIVESHADIVINAAAYTNVDDCEDNQETCFAVNADGVRNVAQSCTEQGIKIVHFSTDYVFDGTQNTPYTEDYPNNPINVYGHSKLRGEQYLREYSNNYILIRTAWLYGKNGKNFVDTILEKAQLERSLQVVDDQIGSPTYTVDLASAVMVLIEGNHTGIFHITNRGTCSWYEFALKIVEYTDVKNVEVQPVTSDTFPRKALRPQYSVLSCKKFSHATQRTMRFWQIALKDYLNRRSS
jgi:dTDP-4-dehydrorhamnose reductase